MNAGIDPPGFEELEHGALVDSARSGRLLVRVALPAVPFVVLLTGLSTLCDRDEWRDGSIGPLVATVFVFTLPALLAGSRLQRAESPEPPRGRQGERRGTLHAT